MSTNPTRGERNKNPGNIERGAILWQGMAADQSADPRFIVFSKPEFGIRALAKILLTYYRKDGLNTVKGIINRWAPPTENDDTAYVNHVCTVTGFDQDAPLAVDDPNTLELLVKGIIEHENGRCVYSDDAIVFAIDEALA